MSININVAKKWAGYAKHNARVEVEGKGGGRLMYFGPTQRFPYDKRCGVELDEPNGKHGGLDYFLCKEGHGVIVAFSKVTLEEYGSKPRRKSPSKDAFSNAQYQHRLSGFVGASKSRSPQKQQKSMFALPDNSHGGNGHPSSSNTTPKNASEVERLRIAHQEEIQRLKEEHNKQLQQLQLSPTAQLSFASPQTPPISRSVNARRKQRSSTKRKSSAKSTPTHRLYATQAAPTYETPTLQRMPSLATRGNRSSGRRMNPTPVLAVGIHAPRFAAADDDGAPVQSSVPVRVNTIPTEEKHAAQHRTLDGSGPAGAVAIHANAMEEQAQSYNNAGSAAAVPESDSERDDQPMSPRSQEGAKDASATHAEHTPSDTTLAGLAVAPAARNPPTVVAGPTHSQPLAVPHPVPSSGVDASTEKTASAASLGSPRVAHPDDDTAVTPRLESVVARDTRAKSQLERLREMKKRRSVGGSESPTQPGASPKSPRTLAVHPAAASAPATPTGGTTTTGSDKHLSADGDDTTVAPAAASTADASASTPTKESSISRGGRMSVAKRAGLYMQTAGGSFKQRESDEKAKKARDAEEERRRAEAEDATRRQDERSTTISSPRGGASVRPGGIDGEDTRESSRHTSRTGGLSPPTPSAERTATAAQPPPASQHSPSTAPRKVTPREALEASLKTLQTNYINDALEEWMEEHPGVDPATSRAWANERKTVHTEFLDDIYHPAIRDFEAKSRPPSASIEQPLASQPDDMQATRVGATTPAAEDAAVPLVSTEASAPVQPRPLHDTAQLDKNLDKAKVPPPIAAKKVKGSAVVDVKIDKKLPPPVAAKKSKVASDAPKSTKEAPSKQTAKKVPPPVVRRRSGSRATTPPSAVDTPTTTTDTPTTTTDTPTTTTTTISAPAAKKAPPVVRRRKSTSAPTASALEGEAETEPSGERSDAAQNSKGKPPPVAPKNKRRSVGYVDASESPVKATAWNERGGTVVDSELLSNTIRKGSLKDRMKAFGEVDSVPPTPLRGHNAAVLKNTNLKSRTSPLPGQFHRIDDLPNKMVDVRSEAHATADVSAIKSARKAGVVLEESDDDDSDSDDQQSLKAQKVDGAQADNAAKERAQKDAEEQAKQEAEEKAKKEAHEKAKKEAEEKSKQEAEAKAQKEAEQKAKLAAEEKFKKEAEEKSKKEAEEKARRDQEASRPSAPKTDEANPFGGASVKREAKKEEEVNPFGGASAKKEAKKEEEVNPFGGASAKKEGKKEEEVNPFGGASAKKEAKKDEEVNPFGGASAKKEAKKDEVNPFGGTSAEKAKKDEEVNPFGGASAKKKTAKDDEPNPFGSSKSSDVLTSDFKVTIHKTDGKLGLSINEIKGKVFVTKVVPGGLAANARVKVGMHFVQVNGADCLNNSKEGVTDLLKKHDPLELVLRAPTKPQATSSSGADVNPFGGAKISKKEEEANPFGGVSVKKEAKEDEANPFGGAAGKKVATKEAEANPFGGASPKKEIKTEAEANPFGGTSPKKEIKTEAEANPFGGTSPKKEIKKGDEANPFGGTSPKKEIKKGDEANPFGGTSTRKDSQANPFGGIAPSGAKKSASMKVKPTDAANPFGGGGEANPFGGAPSGVKKGSKSMKVPSKASATQANPFGGAPPRKPAAPIADAANPFGTAPGSKQPAPKKAAGGAAAFNPFG